ncbi:NAD-dependent epimerase/dehydratase family protein [Halorubrum kocurii]|uniref:NAD-dependent epimerase/dehydratase n=1 Tax=Halorubrum kocurii JCM 14978 TaxID=1230456 RepID=M0PKA3_9EURY|nr:SDR family oxidoreductase [Halorubrum kocurii]EMA70378.1 NAD-dependent epimerase/dehydratase [Halorubrum kocurii JCM 14978]
MNVLITGGCGYIGSALLPKLLEDETVDSVTVLDNLAASTPRNLMGLGVGTPDHVTFQRGDVREYGDVEKAMGDTDTVIHLAAITGADSTHERRAETFDVNYEGTENVVRAAGKLDVGNVVFASSCNLYGRASSTDIDETTEPDPLNPYAEAKYEAETLIRDTQTKYGFDATALRMSTNYGYSPGVRFNLVVNYFVFRALTNRPLTIYGDGSNWRPFIHVQDAARAYKHAALHPGSWPQDIYNVGANNQNYQVETIAEIIQDELNHDLEITYLRDEHPGPSYHVNFDRLAETEFSTEYTLREGVRELADQFTNTHQLTAPLPQ